MTSTEIPQASSASALAPAKLRSPFYKELWVQVIIAIGLAIALGHFRPAVAIAMKPLGDGFIKLISMIVSLIVLCTVVTGIAGMGSIKRVGRVGGKALLYFELVSTLALFIGLLVGNVIHPGSGLNVNPSTLDAKSVQDYAGQAKVQSVTEYLMHMIPTTAADAFVKGDILQVLLVSMLFGFALSLMGPSSMPIIYLFDSLAHAVFQVVNIIMRFAPLGAFGAMSFTVGKYGVASLGPLAKLIATFWITSVLFVFLVLGAIARLTGFSVLRFLFYIKEEILLVLSTSSSDTALPTLMAKLQKLGCSKPLVGLMIPAGYTFNIDGACIYMTLVALFVAQATNTHLSLLQQITLLSVAMLTSKGLTGVQGASFIALVSTLTVIPSIPVAGMTLILGIDRFMSMCRGTVNMIGNGVATLVVARWEKEVDSGTLRSRM